MRCNGCERDHAFTFVGSDWVDLLDGQGIKDTYESYSVSEPGLVQNSSAVRCIDSPQCSTGKKQTQECYRYA